MGLKHRLEDLILANGIPLTSSTSSHKQRKASRLERNAAYFGLSAKKTKVTRINARWQDSIKISEAETEDTEELNYLPRIHRDKGWRCKSRHQEETFQD